MTTLTQDSNETYYRYEFYQFRGDVKKYKTLNDIMEICKDHEYMKQRIQHKWNTTTNKKTAEKYNIIQVL